MKELVFICEGNTEVKLVQNLIYTKLEKWFYPIKPITLLTGKNPAGGAGKGGFRSSEGYKYALKQIIDTANLYSDKVITTFFDLFRFPSDISCYTNAKYITDPIEKAIIYEKQLKEDVYAKIEGNILFIPYFQPCESEAFLFVDPLISAMEMGNTDDDVKIYESKINDIRKNFKSPEYINTHKGPSLYLEEFVENYKKNKVGKGGFSWRAAKEIGIDAICNECEHFNEWINNLLEIGLR
jgi:hypothetical protein